MRRLLRRLRHRQSIAGFSTQRGFGTDSATRWKSGLQMAGSATGFKAPAAVDEFTGRSFDYVITVCYNAKESCPIFPATTQRIHWSIKDPAAAEGSEEGSPSSGAHETK